MSGTKTFGMWYKATNYENLEAYIDFNWTINLDDHKRTFSYAFFFGKSLISWSKKKQHTNVFSTIEEKYMVSSSPCT